MSQFHEWIPKRWDLTQGQAPTLPHPPHYGKSQLSQWGHRGPVLRPNMDMVVKGHATPAATWHRLAQTCGPVIHGILGRKWAAWGSQLTELSVVEEPGHAVKLAEKLYFPSSFFKKIKKWFQIHTLPASRPLLGLFKPCANRMAGLTSRDNQWFLHHGDALPATVMKSCQKELSQQECHDKNRQK